jgi:predicted DNA-binding protein (UPF0278 family)
MAEIAVWTKRGNFDSSQIEDLGLTGVSIENGADAVVVSADEQIGDYAHNLGVILESQGFRRH